jgi:3alpha(or 20beta)-hydroxysteroid dehydrogenase
MNLEHIVVLVSGAARGIGAAEARAFVAAGARVVLGDILDEQGRRVADELNGVSKRARGHCVHLDVTRPEDWMNAVASAEETFGRLTTLVNNAGISGRLGIEATSEDEWHRVLDTDLTSAWLGMKASIPAMRRAGGGRHREYIVGLRTRRLRGRGRISRGQGRHSYAHESRGSRICA